MSNHEFDELLSRLAHLEALIESVVHAVKMPSVIGDKQWYSVPETAALVNRAKFTVRNWAASGRIEAHKRSCGRGKFKEWMISAKAIERYRDNGLDPPPGGTYRHPR